MQSIFYTYTTECVANTIDNIFANTRYSKCAGRSLCVAHVRTSTVTSCRATCCEAVPAFSWRRPTTVLQQRHRPLGGHSWGWHSSHWPSWSCRGVEVWGGGAGEGWGCGVGVRGVREVKRSRWNRGTLLRMLLTTGELILMSIRVAELINQ